MEKYKPKKELKELFRSGYKLSIFIIVFLILSISLTLFLFLKNFTVWDYRRILSICAITFVFSYYIFAHMITAKEIIECLSFQNNTTKKLNEEEILKIKRKVLIPFIGFFIVKKKVFSSI